MRFLEFNILNFVSLRGAKRRGNLFNILRDCFAPEGARNDTGSKFLMVPVLCVFIFWVFLLCINPAWSEDISVSVEVSSNEITLGEAADLTISIHGSQDATPIQMPAIDGLEIQYRGPSRQISIVNGAMSSSLSLNYSIFALKAGQVQIPALDIVVAGKSFKTEPISINVADLPRSANSSSLPTLPSQAQSQSLGQTAAQSLKDKIFMVIKVDKNEVFVNEKILVKILLYVSSLQVQISPQPPKLDAVGFSLGDFAQPNQYEQVVNGVRFNVVEFDTFIYPTRSGDITLGPAKLDCNLLVKSRNRHGIGSNSFFDDDFFNDFFNSAQKRPITVSSDQVTLKILSPPEEGKPVSFNGAVGKYSFDASLSPLDVKVGDPLTLRMTISGDGNRASIEFPQFKKLDGFKFYDPSIKEEKGNKVFEQVIIPENDRVKEIPAVEFSFFDPESKQYEKIVKGPFAINVATLTEEERSKVIEKERSAVVDSSPEKIGQDIIFIKSHLGQMRETGSTLYKNPLYYVFLGIFLSVWLTLLVYLKRNYKFETDSRFARQVMAPKQAQQGLRQAKEFLSKGQNKEFHDVLHKTLENYLSNKFELPIGSVTVEEIKNHKKFTLKDNTVLADIKSIFDECDQVRFASISFDKAAMERAYERVEKIIDSLERTIK